MQLLIPPPLVALACALLMWAVSTLTGELRIAFPLQDMLAYALIAAGLALDVVSVLAFFKAKTTITPLSPEKSSRLVVSGFYRITRNPMYLGMLLILTGIALLLGSPLNVLLLAAFIAYITAFQIKPEERRLDTLFGEEYAAYKNRVRRWL